MMPVDLDLSESSDVARSSQLPSAEEVRTSQPSSLTRDVEDPQHHDQLPSREEYLAQKPQSSVKKPTRNSAMLWIVVAFPVILGASFIIIFMVALGNSTPAVTYNNTGSAPTLSPEKARVYQIVDFVTKEMEWSDAQDLMDPSSPQWKACAWLADFDRRNVPLADTLDFRQRYALATFYFAMDGRNWNLLIGWLEDTDICDWNVVFSDGSNEDFVMGVDCECPALQPVCQNDAPNSVKAIRLPSMSLKGSIPKEIGLLPDIFELRLSNNNITGQLSTGIGDLLHLLTLDLHKNSITGKIPIWLSVMQSITFLNLAENMLSGELPSTMYDMSNLHTLNLVDNLLEGSIDVLTGAPYLESIFLEGNAFSGTISADFIESLRSLQALDLSGNAFNGTLPENLWYPAELYIVDLSANNFTGPIPSASDLSNIYFISLQNNYLTGSIPDSLGTMLVELQHLDLANNGLTGTIPSTLSTLNYLQYLFLAFNEALTPAAIPSFLGNMTGLIDLSLQKTNREGDIPTLLGQLVNLQLLDLADNAIGGSIPSELGDMSSLRFALLQKNELLGSLPSEVVHWSNLEVLLVYGNLLTGDMDVVCSAPNVTDFGSDCAEQTGSVNCTCCTFCCPGNSFDCVKQRWYSDLDPLWETKFVRESYQFNVLDELRPANWNGEDLVPP